MEGVTVVLLTSGRGHSRDWKRSNGKRRSSWGGKTCGFSLLYEILTDGSRTGDARAGHSFSVSPHETAANQDAGVDQL
jgi:hypothetical protein